MVYPFIFLNINLKTKTMKTTFFKISAFILLLALMGSGCEKEEQDQLNYQGKVITLNQGSGCMNIIEIVKTIKDSELTEGTTIAFNPELSRATLKVGDIVYFKIIKYEKYKPHISTQPCPFPQFTAIIEFPNN
jgi:hypothetical protein